MATVGTGKYTYELIENWAKLPPGETFGNTSAVATDSPFRAFQMRIVPSEFPVPAARNRSSGEIAIVVKPSALTAATSHTIC